MNTSAPAIVVYGSSRRWPPETFRTNLQGYFLVTNTAVLVVHGLNGNLTTAFGRSASWSLPGIATGFLIGLWLVNRINPARFTKLVLVLLLVLGFNNLLDRSLTRKDAVKLKDVPANPANGKSGDKRPFQ